MISLVDIEGDTGFTELEELCQFNSDFPEGERISFKRLKLKLLVLLGSLLDAANRLLPGATVATLLMLGALHARRLYEDSKVFLFFSYLSRNQVFFFPLFSHSQHPGSTHSEEFFYTVVGCIVFL
jgi:hypothetical protein